MPRLLGASQNELTILDHLSGSELKIAYRMPTEKERADYANGAVQRRGNKIRVTVGQARQKFGRKILAGIRDGDFAFMENGEAFPLSSNRDSPHYREGWRDLVAQYAPDVLELLALRVFDAPVEAVDGQDEEPDPGEDAEKN